jgi:small subunit ribosomal protein S17
MHKRGRKKEQIGVVLSNKMDKTVVVRVTRKMRHPDYGKIVIRSKKFYVHDETDAIQEGQTVRMMETRPLSKLKRWRIVEVMA